MNTSPEGRIVPLRRPVCIWCLVALCALPWLVIALAVWAFLTYGA